METYAHASAPATGGKQVSRRTLTRAAVWAVPVVAATTAAPAFAASAGLCSPSDRRAVVVNSLQKLSDTSATLGTTDPDGAGTDYSPVTITATSSLSDGLRYGSAASGAANVQFSVQLLGGLASVALHQRPRNFRWAGRNRDDYLSRTTFTMSRRMYDLSFTLTDIDSLSNDYWDFVYIESSSPFTVSGLGNRVAGSGTAGSPLRAISGNVPTASNATNGNATITFATVSSFTVVYGSYENGDVSQSPDGGDQVIGLGDFRGFVLPDACG